MPKTNLESLAVDRSRFFKKQSLKARKALSEFDSRNVEVAVNLYNYIENTPGMSRAIIAEKLDVSQAYLCKLINGQINLSIKTIEKYEETLGILLLPKTQKKAIENKLMTSLPAEKICGAEAFSFDTSRYYESYIYIPEYGNQFQICGY